MSTSVPSTGLFVEAAFGLEGQPGQNGVTGAGEAHELAWKQAIDSALGAQVGSELPELASCADGVVLQDDASVMNDPARKESNPVSWDRLSMTVASMVAWSMQVEVADDEIAQDIVPSVLLGEEGATIESENLVAPSAAASMDEDVVVVAPLSETSAFDAEPERSHVANAHLLEPDVRDQQEALDQEFIGNKREYVSSVDATTDQVLSKPKTVDLDSEFQDQDGLNVREVADADRADSSGIGPPRLVGPVALEDLENVVPTAVSTKPDTHNAQQVQGKGLVTTSVDTAPRQTAESPPDLVMDVVRHVRATSAVDSLQNGRERLEGIRAVLAELDTQVDIKTVSDVVHQRTPANTMEQMVGADQSALATENEVSGMKGLEGQAANVAKPLKDAKPNTDANNAADDAESDALNMQDSEDGGLTERKGLRPAPPAVKRAHSMKNDHHRAGAETANTQAELSENLAGTENAEISKDQEQVVESVLEDSQTIEASEIPELAVQDMSNLDIDIDDPMGAVRLAMTREAEEVSVRLETPQEVLEEYREMREEMDQRLADHGLDLSHFSANAHAEAGEDSGSGNPFVEESNQDSAKTTGNDPQGLASEGSSARLVNRIV